MSAILVPSGEPYPTCQLLIHENELRKSEGVCYSVQSGLNDQEGAGPYSRSSVSSAYGILSGASRSSR